MKKISIFLLAFSSLFAVSCDQDFEEVNTTPNQPTEVPAHLFLGNIVRNNQNTIYSMTNGGDMGMCWSQQVSKVEYNDEERYIPRQGSIDAVWNSMYTTVLKESKVMEEVAKEEGNTNLQAISMILRANAFHILTDLYGPIPFTDALDDNNIKPKYDSELVVYAGINALLSQADVLLATGTGVVPASSDIVYAGDMSKWRKLANALRLKALIRISKVSGVNNAAQISSIVASGNLMSSNSDTAQLVYFGAQPDANPIYETVIFGLRPEYKMSSVFVNKLNLLADPRLPIYAQTINGGTGTTYVGNVPGVKPAAAAGISSLGTNILSPTFPGVIMSYAQQQFLIAEAINEGYVAGGLTAAETAYKSGITASAAQFGVTASMSAYLVNPLVTFGTQADAREKIAEQTWIALYGQGFEAWTEWRRTKYPVLSPVANAAIPSIPLRLLYNSLEASLNKANYEAAKATLNNGDNLTSKLIWN
jgi:hypothetical protein